MERGGEAPQFSPGLVMPVLAWVEPESPHLYDSSGEPLTPHSQNRNWESREAEWGTCIAPLPGGNEAAMPSLTSMMSEEAF